MARNDDAPRLEARGQTPNQQQSSAHESDMYALATRIRWLEHHRHWWIRSIRERQWSR